MAMGDVTITGSCCLLMTNSLALDNANHKASKHGMKLPWHMVCINNYTSNITSALSTAALCQP